MDAEAGELISVFIEKYIRPPIEAIGAFDQEDLSDINLSWSNNKVTISNGKEDYDILRESDAINASADDENE